MNSVVTSVIALAFVFSPLAAARGMRRLRFLFDRRHNAPGKTAARSSDWLRRVIDSSRQGDGVA